MSNKTYLPHRQALAIFTANFCSKDLNSCSWPTHLSASLPPPHGASFTAKGGFRKPQRAMSFLPFRSCRLCQTLSWLRRRSPCWTRRWQSRTSGSSWWRDCRFPCSSAQGATEPSSPLRWLKSFYKGPNRCGSGDGTLWGGVSYRGGHMAEGVTHREGSYVSWSHVWGWVTHQWVYSLIGVLPWAGHTHTLSEVAHQLRSHSRWGCPSDGVTSLQGGSHKRVGLHTGCFSVFFYFILLDYS